MWQASKAVRPMVWWAFFAAYVLLSLFVMGRYLYSSNMGDPWRVATLEQMVYGEAERPFVYRQLVPLMLRAVVAVVPEGVQKNISKAVEADIESASVFRLYIQKRKAFQGAMERQGSYFLRIIAAIVVYGFLWLYIASMHRLAANLFPSDPAMALSAPIVGLLAIPAMMIPTVYMYDIAALGLFAAACCCLLEARWKWFVFWFVLASINKETAVFIIALCALWLFGRMERSKYYNFITLLFVIFMIVRCVIYWHFRDNPGLFLATSYKFQQYALLTSGYNRQTLLVIFGLFFLLVFRWQEKPLQALHGITLLVLMFFAYCLYGRPNEVRVFLDVLPLSVILMTHTLIACTGISHAAVFAPNNKPHDSGNTV